MKLLHLSLGSHQTSQAKALEHIANHGYLGIDWKQITNWGPIVEKIKEFEPTHTFMQIQSDGIPIEVIKSIPGMIYNWTGDIRSPIPKCYFDYAEVPNVVTLFCSQEDADTFSDFHKSGYLDIGYEESIFCDKGVVGEPYDVVFFGNHYPNRFPLSNFRLEMVKRLKAQKQWRFGLFGIGWNRVFDYEIPNLNQNPWAEASIYRASKVAINISHFNHYSHSSDRIYRLTACGGAACTCFASSGIQTMFNGDEVLVWRTYEELFEVIKFLLNNEDDRLTYAHNAAIACMSRHTWTNRMVDFLRLTRRWDSTYVAPN